MSKTKAIPSATSTEPFTPAPPLADGALPPVDEPRSNTGAELVQPAKSKGDEHAEHMQAAFYLADTDNQYISEMPGQYKMQLPLLLNALVERAYRKGQEDLGYVQGALMASTTNETLAAEFERGRAQGRKDSSPVQ